MAGPTLNTHDSTGTNSSLASYSISVTGVASLDTILVFVINATNANPTLVPTSVVDGQGSYTLVATANAAFNNSMTIWALTNATSGTHTVTITFASAVGSAALWSTWSSAAGSFVDQGGGTWYSASQLTLSQVLVNAYSNDTVISAWNTGGTAPTSHSGTSWFSGGALGAGVGAQWETQSGSGSYSPSATYAANQYGDFVAVSLQNATGSSLMGQICL